MPIFRGRKKDIDKYIENKVSEGMKRDLRKGKGPLSKRRTRIPGSPLVIRGNKALRKALGTVFKAMRDSRYFNPKELRRMEYEVRSSARLTKSMKEAISEKSEVASTKKNAKHTVRASSRKKGHGSGGAERPSDIGRLHEERINNASSEYRGTGDMRYGRQPTESSPRSPSASRNHTPVRPPPPPPPMPHQK